MADKILVLRIGNSTLRLAEPTHSYDDGSTGWQLLVEPKLLEEFIDEHGNEGRGTTRVEEVEDRDGQIEELRAEMKSMKSMFDHAMSDVRTLTATITRIEATVGYKHLEEQYPKREQLATKQDDEALLRAAKAGAQPVIPPQTKPMHRFGEPRVHDLTGRFPKIDYQSPPTKVDQIVAESKTKVDYDAARVKAAAQPDRTVEEAILEAEKAVDETEKPSGFCGTCGEQTRTSVCAECAMLINRFDAAMLPDPEKPITFGRARYIREWLERCEKIGLKAGHTFDAQESDRLDKIKSVNEVERQSRERLTSGMVRQVGNSVGIRIPGDGNMRAYVNKEMLKNPLHEASEPYVGEEPREEQPPPPPKPEQDDSEGMPF